MTRSGTAETTDSICRVQLGGQCFQHIICSLTHLGSFCKEYGAGRKEVRQYAGLRYECMLAAAHSGVCGEVRGAGS